ATCASSSAIRSASLLAVADFLDLLILVHHLIRLRLRGLLAPSLGAGSSLCSSLGDWGSRVRISPLRPIHPDTTNLTPEAFAYAQALCHHRRYTQTLTAPMVRFGSNSVVRRSLDVRFAPDVQADIEQTLSVAHPTSSHPPAFDSTCLDRGYL